jgi:hypothetical protein
VMPPCRGIFHRAASLIPLAYTSIRWSTLSPRRHCVFALTIYGSFLVALQPYDLASDTVTVIPDRRTPRTRRRMPVILCERAVLDGPSRDALQPKSDWPRLIHAFGENATWGTGYQRKSRNIG